MWKVKSTKKEHWDQFIFVDEECVVGRKDATLLITNDPSVSRRHAVLFVKHPEENLGNPSKKASLFLRDEGSKYGTSVNGVCISKEKQLSNGDVIKFGQFESEFRIHYEPLIVTTSCLDVPSKNKLKKIILKLGGHLVSEWQPSCTHLVMNSVKITIKALCCLTSLKPIVSPEYFEELEKKLKSSAIVTPPKEFIPPIGESLIDKDVVSFDVNPERKNLFKNKTFFFMDNKQFKKLNLGIMSGGGNASVLSGDKFDPDILLKENTCFIEPLKGQLTTEESKNFLKNIINALQTKNLRMIPESDIGLAVAYASTEKFCNPSFKIGSVVLSSQGIPSQSLTEREVYAPDTEDSIKRPKLSTSSYLSSLNYESKNKKNKLETADSLNLTSFKEDPEDVFEIPLSAEIKRELDDIFDVEMKEDEEINQNEEELGPTVPVEPVADVQVNPVKPVADVQVNPVKPVADVQKTPVEPKRTEKIHKNRISPKKPKVEQNTSLVNGNGFTSTMMNGDAEVNLPRNLITVKFASLIVRKPVPTENQNINSNVKNFKKFKKVLPLKAQSLPRIIGVHELAPYDKDAAKLTENWDDEPEVINNEPIKGAFDWGSQNY